MGNNVPIEMKEKSGSLDGAGDEATASVLNFSARQYLAAKGIEIRAFNENDMDSMIASSVAGACATAAGHPIDTIKVRMQIADVKSKAGFIRTMYTVAKTEGMMPFYRGFLPPTLTKTVTTMLFFTTNSYIKENLIENQRRRLIRKNEPVPDTIVLSLWETFYVAGFCGLLLCPFLSVAELIKIQLQSEKNIAGRPKKYDNMFECTKYIIRHRQLHRGMLTTAFRVIPGWGFYLFAYDGYNRYFERDAVLGSNETLSSWNVTLRVLVSGTLAGWIGWIFSYPMDYIKTQIQAHPITKWNYLHTKTKVHQPPRIRDVAAHTMEHYGVRGFFRGLGPCLIRSFPVNMTNFWVYETVVSLRRSSRRLD